MLDLADEENPMQAPWPSSTKDIERLSASESARCLRVRIWAIQDFLFCFRYHPITQQACLWLDQHAPLMLALEAGVDACALEPGPFLYYVLLVLYLLYLTLEKKEYNPIENEPFFPILPKNCNFLLPTLWCAKSTTYLRKYPILRLLWKAAPRMLSV